VAQKVALKSTQMSKQKILLVDDEPDILEMIGFNLEREGFEVYTAPNGRKGLELAKAHEPDLILLDVMMPEMDGMETCRELRDDPKLKNAIIAFLTARNEDYSQIAGFDAGADDYISKPIKPRVLVSKVKALLRRGTAPVAEQPKRDLNGIVIDKERYVVYKDGGELSLPKKEFELLALLASQPGRVFTRENILSSVWGNDVIVGDRTIDVHIRKLREKLGDDFFKTIKGVGYKFEP
jgi:two-component system alkaline phosphatase synthesis response regulator PhoP